MDLKTILEKPLIVSPEDTVSRVASAMSRERRHEAVVMKDGSFEGVVIAGDIVKRNIQNPEATRIDSFIKKIEVAFPETSVQDAINEILINNFKSLPVESFKDDERVMYMVTKTGLLKLLKGDSLLKGKTAKEIMSFPYSIDRNDNIVTAKSIIRDMEVSAIPVVDEDNKVLGVIETVDLLKASVHSMERAERGERSGEKKSVKDVIAGSVMQTNFPRASPETPLRKITELLLSGTVPVAVIEENDKLVGMITPRDILKMFGARTEGVYVTVNGIQKEDNFIKSLVDEEIKNAVRKINKVMSIQYFVINIKKHREDGKRSKYSVKSRLMTQKGPFFARDFDWDLTKAMKGMLHALEREIIKRTGKNSAYPRGS